MFYSYLFTVCICESFYCVYVLISESICRRHLRPEIDYKCHAFPHVCLIHTSTGSIISVLHLDAEQVKFIWLSISPAFQLTWHSEDQMLSDHFLFDLESTSWIQINMNPLDPHMMYNFLFQRKGLRLSDNSFKRILNAMMKKNGGVTWSQKGEWERSVQKYKHFRVVFIFVQSNTKDAHFSIPQRSDNCHFSKGCYQRRETV